MSLRFVFHHGFCRVEERFIFFFRSRSRRAFFSSIYRRKIEFRIPAWKKRECQKKTPPPFDIKKGEIRGDGSHVSKGELIPSEARPFFCGAFCFHAVFPHRVGPAPTGRKMPHQVDPSLWGRSCLPSYHNHASHNLRSVEHRP